MIHPLLRLIVTQPRLLADHAEAYVDLVGEEVSRTTTAVAIRIGAAVGAIVMTLVFLVLVGVSVMLWAVTPAAQLQTGWVLILVPAIPAVLALICGLAAAKKTDNAFVELKQQFAADMSMIRQVSGA